MKKRFACFCVLVLVLLSGCGGEEASRASATPTPLPVVDETWQTIYAQLFKADIVLSEYAGTTMKAYELEGSDLLALEDSTRKNLYWMEGFALCDLTFDGVPELILNTGEVEKEMYLFTVREGKIVLLSHGLSGNQDYTDAVALYVHAQTGEKAYFSESLTGTGAGSWYEFAKLDPVDAHFTVLRSYNTEYDPQADTYVPKYKVQGEDVEQSAYDQAVQAFASEWRRERVVPFRPMGDDPAQAMQEAIAAFAQ